jgi:hypothetical protein
MRTYDHCSFPCREVEHTGGGVYYLFFASPNAVATGIVEGIFKKYADYGE